jgi:hypothetical protein
MGSHLLFAALARIDAKVDWIARVTQLEAAVFRGQR